MLTVRVISRLYLNQALFLEMTYNNKKVIVSVIYRSPSQNNDKFELFLSNFEQLLNSVNKSKPSLSAITRSFNARLPYGRLMTSIHQRYKLYSFTSSNGLSQLINEPAYIQINSYWHIDLIFTDQPNLSVNTGVHTTFHPNCHH